MQSFMVYFGSTQQYYTRNYIRFQGTSMMCRVVDVEHFKPTESVQLDHIDFVSALTRMLYLFRDRLLPLACELIHAIQIVILASLTSCINQD